MPFHEGVQGSAFRAGRLAICKSFDSRVEVMGAKYCQCCGKRYDTKSMCPACAAFMNKTIEKCAVAAEESGFYVGNADRAIAELIRKMKATEVYIKSNIKGKGMGS